MTSKSKFFSWSKGRQSASEPYHRTGGLLAIDTSVGDSSKETFLTTHGPKNISKTERRRLPNLTIVPPDYNNSHLACLSPASAHHNAALVNSASNLLAVVNDMLRSPALSATVCPGSASIHNKPLPSRPRSVSLPSTPDLPVELPGSILSEAQGLPSLPGAGSATTRAASHHFRRDTHSPSDFEGAEQGPVDPFDLLQESLSLGEIGRVPPERSMPNSTMRSVRSGNSLSSSAAAKPSPSKVPQHKKSLSETSLQRRPKSRPNLITSPSSTDSKLTTCSVSTTGGHTSSNDSTKARVGADKSLQPSPLIVEGKPWRRTDAESSKRRDELGTAGTPTPTTTRSKQVEELKATITAQDQTISTLQAQFGSLRASHDAHVASLVDAHTAEVASLKEYTRVLEEQQSQRTLHHASSNHLLLLLDTTEPQEPSRESPQTTAGSNSASSIRSFKTALEQQTRTPQQSRDSPEMENLKRKLSVAKRPETGNPNLIRENNQLRQNNAALQKQIESLMSKLNQSKKSERGLTQTLEEVEKKCTEWQEKASKVEQLEKSTSALQNTIDHLEYRLEMANAEKLDAEEQLFNLQSQKTPFDSKPPKLEVPAPRDRQSAHMSMSTVFSSGSPISPQNESQEPTTLAAFIAHIERLQEQIRQKDARIVELEAENERLRESYDQLEHDLKKLNLQSDIQGQLLKKTRETDVHIDQLRTAIIDRESIIGEKEKSIRMAERQLEHHKLLLHAEIRRHATMNLFADSQDPLPDLTTLASKDDIDRWIDRLQGRLKKENPKASGKKPEGDLETTVEDLRREIDFYVREIIYYKLDIKGYKSDIKKLKHLAMRMGNYGSRASDMESPTPSLARSTDTPIRARFSAGTPGLGISDTPSPVSTGPISATLSIGRPITPPATSVSLDPSSADTIKPTRKHIPKHLDLNTPIPQTPRRKVGVNVANEADNIDPGISPRSVARLSPERRKPTPPSPDQEKFGDLATNFPLSTPAAPKRHDTIRSNSDSIIQLYATPRTPEWSPASNQGRVTDGDEKKIIQTRGRSASDPKKGKTTPERPPRPRLGLFDSPTTSQRAAVSGLPTPPRVDVMAEAMRNSPERPKPEPRTQNERGSSDPSGSGIPAPSPTRNIRSSSSNTGSALPPPLKLRPRAGSADSSTANIATQPSSPQRKFSASSSGSNTPFVIAMGSPYNPALISPTSSVPPSACSITGKSAPLKIVSPTSRTGVGGTMASSTPLTSPISPTDASKHNPFFGGALPNSSTKPQPNLATKPISPPQSRKTSISSVSGPANKKKENETAPPPSSLARSRTASGSTSTHSRNTSGSSIRNAMQLPGSLMKGKGKARKDSISLLKPLASPFDIDRGTPTGEGFEIGKAI